MDSNASNNIVRITQNLSAFISPSWRPRSARVRHLSANACSLRRRALGHGAGGPDCVGVFGHRNNTSLRGRGDPGDAIWTALAAFGFEGVDHDGGEDLELGRARQAVLVARGERITVDGIVVPASLAAAQR